MGKQAISPQLTSTFTYYILIGKLNINNSISRGLIHAGPSKSFIFSPKLSGKHREVDGKTGYFPHPHPRNSYAPQKHQCAILKRLLQ